MTLDVARGRLTALEVSADDVDQADARASREVHEAVEAANAAPDADPADAFTDVWADGSAAWRN